MNGSITVYKHMVGIIAILLAGLLVDALFIGAIFFLGSQHMLTAPLFYIMAFVAVVIILVAVVQAYVYSLAKIELDDDGIAVTNYLGLFDKQDGRADWPGVVEANYIKGGIFAMIFGYGTVIIQTAGERSNMQMTFVPRPDELVAQIDRHLS